MECPWGCGWEGPAEEYSKHLESCKKYPPHYEAIKERARIPSSERLVMPGIPRETQIYILEPKELAEEIMEQVEYITQKFRAPKYGDLFKERIRALMTNLEKTSSSPGYWKAVKLKLGGMSSHHSSNPGEIKQPTLKELLKGEVLNGYLEASRVRTLEQFMPFTFLFDEGLTTEEKITVKAINRFEAAIKARDEFTKRRGTYHKTSRLVG